MQKIINAETLEAVYIYIYIYISIFLEKIILQNKFINDNIN